MLEHEYGVPHCDVTWVAELDEDVAFEPHEGLVLEKAPPGKKVEWMLAEGELDAVLHPDLIEQHCQIKTVFDQTIAFPYSFGMQNHSPFRYFNSSPDIIRLAVMMYVRYPLSLRQVEDLLFERGIGICHETVRFWWNRFGPLFAAEIRKRRVDLRSYSI